MSIPFSFFESKMDDGKSFCLSNLKHLSLTVFFRYLLPLLALMFSGAACFEFQTFVIFPYPPPYQ